MMSDGPAQRARPARSNRVAVRLALLLTSLIAAGCSTTGPITIRRDRFNFNAAAAESTKEQILLNIVRLRYGESFCFVDIGAMVSHYTLTAGGHAAWYRSGLEVWDSPTLRALYGMRGEPVPDSRTFGTNLEYTDSPTITYTPLSGEDFAKRIMAPIPPATLIYLSQSGWSVDRLLECCVQQLNELANTPTHEVSDATVVDDGRFRRLARVLKGVQDAGGLRFGVEQEATQNATYLYHGAVPEPLQAGVTEVQELLGLPTRSGEKIRITWGAVRQQPNELAMQTRSILATMYALARDIDVPREHSESHEVAPPLEKACCADDPRWLKVQYSRLPQADPFVQVFYNGYWFYIEKKDWTSKRTFALLTYLLSLQASGQGQAVPLLTVPTSQ